MSNRGAEKLGRLLQRKGMTQYTFAKEAEVTQSMLSRYASGDAIPGLAAFIRIRDAARRHRVSISPEDFVRAE